MCARAHTCVRDGAREREIRICRCVAVEAIARHPVFPSITFYCIALDKVHKVIILARLASQQDLRICLSHPPMLGLQAHGVMLSFNLGDGDSTRSSCLQSKHSFLRSHLSHTWVHFHTLSSSSAQKAESSAAWRYPMAIEINKSEKSLFRCSTLSPGLLFYGWLLSLLGCTGLCFSLQGWFCADREWQAWCLKTNKNKNTLDPCWGGDDLNRFTIPSCLHVSLAAIMDTWL